MKQGGGMHQIATGLKDDTASRLDVLQFLDGGEMPIGQHGIGELPHML